MASASRPSRPRPSATGKSAAKGADQNAGRAPARGGAHEVRIIGGQWKRTRLAVVDRPGLRPTPDRVRETLFNWLGQDLNGWEVIDAYAGTGALGLEAASRGAARVLLIEQDGAQVEALRAVIAKLQAHAVQVHKGHALQVLRQQPPASCDLLLLDPPFDAGLYEPSLAAALPLLRPQGWLYLESPTPWSDEALAPLGLQRVRYLKAGAVHAHLLQRVAAQGS